MDIFSKETKKKMESKDTNTTVQEVPDKVDFQRTCSKDERGDAGEREKQKNKNKAKCKSQEAVKLSPARQKFRTT